MLHDPADAHHDKLVVKNIRVPGDTTVIDYVAKRKYHSPETSVRNRINDG